MDVIWVFNLQSVEKSARLKTPLYPGYLPGVRKYPWAGKINPPRTFEFRREAKHADTPQTLRRGTYPVELRERLKTFTDIIADA